jgi:pyruvate/2-oxoglutarate dehydrogenase complex dihydrolipoamide acyltransferase (E2) component
MEIDIVIGADVVGGDGDAEIVRWLVDDGGQVSQGDVVAEIETAKLLLEITAPASGRLTHLTAVGHVVPADTHIARITHG